LHDALPELKVQELAGDVPVGCIPRSMTVLCRGEITRQCKAGEEVVLVGDENQSLGLLR
jgi:DNA replication licensing factor MCM7